MTSEIKMEETENQDVNQATTIITSTTSHSTTATTGEDPTQHLVARSTGSDFSDFTADGNFCVYFKLIRDQADIEEDIKQNAFLPDFVHQFFVESERIFGYKKPIMRMFYSASQLKRYISFEYGDKLSLEKHGIEPDNVMEAIAPVLLEAPYTTNINQFSSDLESSSEKEFRPPGQLIKEFSVEFNKPSMLSRAQLEQMSESLGSYQSNGASVPKTNGNRPLPNASAGRLDLLASRLNGGTNATTTSSFSEPKKRNFCIYKACVDDDGFKPLFAKMQTFVMWFIDAANMIDVDDVHWDFFLVFEKHSPAASTVTTEERYFFVGYATVYRYYAWPDKTRPRISQVLLLPPFRKNSIGTNLLSTVYDWYKSQPSTLDITAEDPNEQFISMRDYVDCKNCMELESFKPDNLMKGWSDEMAKEAQQKLRLCQRQARKVYEILRLKNLDSDDEEAHKKFRLDIKNRLNGPAQRAKLDCEKLEKKGYPLPEELQAKRLADHARYELLDENYQELERQYKMTIKKLEDSS